MADLGLRYAKYNIIDSSTGKYKAFGTGQTKPNSIGKLVSSSFEPTRDTAEIFGDDMLAEHYNGFVEGTLNAEFVNVTDATVADLFGHAAPASDLLTKKGDDVAPAVGYGQVVSKMVDNTLKYKAELLVKVVFDGITNSHNTRGKNVQFGTTSLTGKVMQLDSAMNGFAAGTYYMSKEFSTLDAAEAQVDTWLTPST